MADSLLQVSFTSDPHADPLLGTLVNLGGDGFRVSLLVGGAHVRGVLISAHTYLQLLHAELGEYDTKMGSYGGAMRSYISGQAEDGSSDLSQHDRFTSPRWLHLRDTEVFEAGARRRLGLWRGCAADVSGWALNRPSKESRTSS